MESCARDSGLSLLPVDDPWPRCVAAGEWPKTFEKCKANSWSLFMNEKRVHSLVLRGQHESKQERSQCAESIVSPCWHGACFLEFSQPLL